MEGTVVWLFLVVYMLGFLAYVLLIEDEFEPLPLWTRVWQGLMWPFWLLGSLPFALLLFAMMFFERDE